MDAKHLIDASSHPDGSGIALRLALADGSEGVLTVPFEALGQMMTGMALAGGAAAKKRRPVGPLEAVNVIQTKSPGRVGWDAEGLAIQFPTEGGFPLTLGLSSSDAAVLCDRLTRALGVRSQTGRA